MKGGRILFLSEGTAREASAAHRVFAVGSELERRGWDVQYVAGQLRRIGTSVIWVVGPTELFRCWRLLRRVDVLVVHRTSHVGVWILVVEAKRLGVRVLFDFDDAIQLPWRRGGRHPLYWALSHVLSSSDAALCGSHALAKYAEQYTRAEWVPTAVDQSFLAAKRRRQSPVTIVWFGNGPAHKRNLLALLPALERLSRVSKFRMAVYSTLGDAELENAFQRLASRVEVDLGAKEWVAPEWIAEHVASCDIGIMPLEESEWNRGKCAMKALESMAAGLATVVSGVGENLIVAAGGAALVARSETEWYRALRSLICVPVLREILGARGRQRILEMYTLDQVTTATEAVLCSVIDSGGADSSGRRA